MVSMQRSLSSPVNTYSSLPRTTAAHSLSRSPTPPLLLEKQQEKHVDLSRAPRFASRSPSRRDESTMSLQARRGDGLLNQTSVASPPQPLPPPLSNLMGSTKTSTAAATTATVTATATTTTMSVPTASLTVVPPSTAGGDLGVAKSFPSLAHRPAAQSPQLAPILSSPASPMSSPDDLQQKISSSVASDPSPPPSLADIPTVPYPLFAKPLLQDASLYSNARAAPESEGTSLNELAHLVRLSKYQERKRTNTRVRLQLNLISTALSARLVRCGQMAHRSLTECFRSDDRTNFAKLYNAVHNVRISCDELRKYALLEPELDSLRSPASTESLETATGGSLHSTQASPGSASVTPFFNDISAEARATFISFLTVLRNNPDYLATRLCCLSTAELSSLTIFYQGMEPIDSVLPFHSRQSSGRSSASGRGSSHGSVAGGAGSGKDGDAVQKFLSFQRHDPLSALIHTCFANSAGPDSAEDRRRTDIWATVCARLISEKGAAGEPVLIAVLNAWSAMRDWSGRSNMEWFLMKILEDGAFLLDRAEDQNGTRFNLNEWTSKDQIAAEEFYDRAINDLFEVIDDEDATGIPEGLIELGNQILKKLDSKFVENTRSWLVYKWLFGAWLLSVVIHPETYGLMAEYHVTEYGRQKILKEVALRAQKLVVERTLSLSHLKNAKPVSTPPAIKTHIDNILNRFRGSRTQRPTARLLPARSITSLRETVEVHPYLVVSPADLVTLVNTLFPDRRPRSAHSGSIRSGPGSVSNFSVLSQPVPVNPQRGSNADTYSVLSTSVSSANSDATTSVEPLLESQQTGTSSTRYSPPPSSFSGPEQKRYHNYEDDGHRLRLAVQDMVHALGRECVLGACHPCAERWAVLFISADGNNLSMHMTYDPEEDDPEDDGESSSAGTDDESDDQDSELDQTELDADYHQLRDSILKLVVDYEIPAGLEEGNGKPHTFSNRANRLKKYRLKNKVITTEATSPSTKSSQLQSRNPYWRHMRQEPTQTEQEDPDQGTPSLREEKEKAPAGTGYDESEAAESVLISMLTSASSQSRAQSDFLAAHQYWKAIQQLNKLTSESLRRNGFAALLNIFSRGPRHSIDRSASAVEEYDAWLIWLKQSQERAEGLIDTMMRRLRALRDKMWYVTDVRNSAPYEFSRNIAVALKTMGTTRKWDAYQRSRQSMPRGPAASYLFRTESEIVELLAASEDQGGPNKLSDDQAEKTTRWLQHCGIENFCQGEERIHRFSCEIASCIDKLIGESIIEAPVLWSSDLYARDRRNLEMNRRSGRDRDSGNVPWDDASSVMSYDSESRRFNSSIRSANSAMRGDLRTTLGQNNPSLQSFDSGRYSFSRASTSLSEILDVQDYFSGGLLSPVPTIDTSTTYWSPFQATISPSSATSRAQSPTASTTNLSSPFTQLNHLSRHPQYSHHGSGGMQTPSHLSSSGRPGTSASSVDTVFQQRISEEKARFLADLRQTLTSLLLSDLGNLVFARGSETDSWFVNLGQECIERREAVEKKQRQEALAEKRRRSNRNSLKQIVVDRGEKNNEPGELRSASGGQVGSVEGESSPSIDGRRSQTPETTHSGSHGNDSSATASDHTATGARIQASASSRASKNANLGSSVGANRKGTTEFPFTKAYQRLLRMFCVHPNPYAKLTALFELENLIAASLSSRSTRRRLALLTRSGSSPIISQANAYAQPAAEEATPGLPASRPKPLEETIDNVKGRRSSTMAAALYMASSPTSARGASAGPYMDGRSSSGPASALSTKDAISCVLQSLFRDPTIRPKTLFRDLQFIASFVPSEMLDRTERGKSFWDAGLAALLLKKEVCSTMIEVADEIVGIYTKTRKPPTAAVPPPQDDNPATASGPSSLSSATTYSLADAARMWTITAKEGDPTSQRELAIFYLSNPELVERTTLPLSKPREVFKKSLMEKYAGSSGSGRYHSTHPSNPAPARGAPSPALMCVAIHWMEAAEQGGDELARTFLGQNEMMKASK